MSVQPESDPRVFFAAERTFLAWIRTGLALMGFGFVVARFGLFLLKSLRLKGVLRLRRASRVGLEFDLSRWACRSPQVRWRRTSRPSDA